MSSRPDHAELFRLFGGMCEGTLGPDDFARLEALLEQDADVRRLWLQYCDLECGLARHAAASAATLIFEPAPPSTPATFSIGRRWAIGIAASIAFFLFTGVIFLAGGQASASSEVRKALETHSLSPDRCYAVKVSGEKEGVGALLKEAVLWTRGDRFWSSVESGGKKMLWGRGENGDVWFVLSPQKGAKLAAEEVPEKLQLACELRGLRVESLLRDILDYHVLRHEASPSGTILIYAEPKEGGTTSRFGAALLEIDPSSHVLLRMELKVVFNGRHLATTTSTLMASGIQDDRNYTLEGHLESDAVILDRNSARGERASFLVELLRAVRTREQVEPKDAVK